jgi:dihydroxyacetone synthase
MKACGWNVLEVEDGNFDIEAIVKALLEAKASQDKPTFINVHTTIGIGSKVSRDAKAHGAALGPKDVANVKRTFGFNPDEHFVIPDEVYDFFRDIKTRGQRLETEWEELVARYSEEYPDLHEEFELRRAGKMTSDWRKLIPAKESFPTSLTPSRKSAGIVCNALAAGLKNMLVGTADLTPSVSLAWKGKVDFQHVSCL